MTIKHIHPAVEFGFYIVLFTIFAIISTFVWDELIDFIFNMKHAVLSLIDSLSNHGQY